MKKIAFIIVSLLAFVTACEDSHEGNIAPTYEGYPVATLLEQESSRFSQWADLLKHAGMFSSLNISDNYTCFVPTNEAMQSYLQSKGYSKAGDLPAEDAVLLIRYHTIRGKQYTQSLFTNGIIPDTTATGDFLSIEFKSGGVRSIYVNGIARISTPDIQATNGVIHAIEEVLTPVTETAWDKINTPAYAIMAEAIERTGYRERLNTISETIQNESGKIQQKKLYFTLFAVADQVYNNSVITDLADLAAAVGAVDTDYTNPENELNRYVAYHILEQQHDYSSLASFENEDNLTKNLSPLSANTLINVSQIEHSELGNLLLLNYNQEEQAGISILTENIKAKNGILHEVDHIMPVTSPYQPIKFAWDLTDYADLAGLYPDVFQKSNLASYSTNKIAKGSVNCYTWESLYSNSGYLAYNVYGSTYLAYKMRNHDDLTINLGMYGWVEMQSPTITAGKYKLRVQCASKAGTKNGKFKVYIDGSPFGSEVTTHGTNATNDQLATKDIGTITFTGTASHTFKILQTDEAGITLDYIEFVPQN